MLRRSETSSVETESEHATEKEPGLNLEMIMVSEAIMSQ